MKLKSILVTMLVAALMSAGIATVVLVHPINAAIPNVRTVALPEGSNSISLASDGVSIWYASSAFGHIYRVDPALGTYSQVYTDSGTPHRWIATAYSSAIYPYSPALYLVDSKVATGGLYRYDIAANSLALIASGVGGASGSVWVASQCQHFNTTLNRCLRSQSFVFAASGNQFFKVQNLNDVPGNPPNSGWYAFPYNCSTNAILCGSGGTFPGITSDSNGDIYFTDKYAGRVLAYSWRSNSLRAYTGFTKPTSLTVVGADIHVTENTVSGSVARLNLLTSSIAERVSTSGAPFGITSYAGIVVWGSNSTDGQICALKSQCVNTGQKNYYMLPSSSGAIFFGYQGSAGVGIVNNLLGTVTYTFTGVSSFWGDSNDNLYLVAPLGQSGGTTTVTTTVATQTTTATTTTTTSSTSYSGTTTNQRIHCFVAGVTSHCPEGTLVKLGASSKTVVDGAVVFENQPVGQTLDLTISHPGYGTIATTLTIVTGNTPTFYLTKEG